MTQSKEKQNDDELENQEVEQVDVEPVDDVLDKLIDPSVSLEQEMGIQGTIGKVLADLTGGLTKIEKEEETPAEDASTEETPAEDTTAETSSVEETPIETSTVDETSVGETSTVSSPIETSSVDETSSSHVGIHEPQWVVQFAALPELEHEDVISRLQAGDVLRGYTLPFLNLHDLQLEHPVVFENCHMVGLASKGSTFEQGLSLRNCWVEERFAVGGSSKDREHTKSVVQGHIRMEHCKFDDRVAFVQTEVQGDFRATGCIFAQTVSLDRSQISGQVRMSEGEVSGFSLFQAELSQHLFLSQMTLKGTRKIPSLGMKKAKVMGGIDLRDCDVQGNVELSRSHVGENVYRALRIEKSTIKRLFLNQAAFYGEVQIQDTTFVGLVSAEPPRAEHGYQIGRSTIFNAETTFGGCTFQGKCQFQSAQFVEQVNFSHCQFEKGASFNQAVFQKEAGFWESQSKESLHFRKAFFHGVANFGRTLLAHRSSFNGAVFDEIVTFHESQFDGDIFFTGTRFCKDLKMGRLRCKGGLILQNVDVTGQIHLVQAEIDDRLILSDSRIGSLHSPGTQIGTWATLAKTVVEEDVLLEGAKVGNKVSDDDEEKDFVPGSFYFDGAVCQGRLRMSNAFVRGNLSLNNVTIHQELELMGIRVDGNLLLTKGYFRDVVRCERGVYQGDLVANLSRFRDEASFNHVTCHSARLGGSSFDQGFTMRSTVISDVLTLNNVDVDGKADLSKCSFKRFFFDHFLVDYFMIEREQLGERLSSEMVGNYTQAKNEYGILRQAFLVRNRYQDMDWAYYRFCQSNRSEKPNSLMTGIEWLLFDLGFGYGTRPMNIAGVALGIVLLFAALFFFVPFGVANQVGHALQYVSVLDATHLSVLTFASMEYSSHQPYAAHWLKYMFAVEGLLGIFLITLFVATISRKIIRT